MSMSLRKAKSLLHEEMLIVPYKKGIKLLLPDARKKFRYDQENSNIQLIDMLKLNMSVYFLDPDSTTYLMNDYGAGLCGFTSAAASIGRTLLDVAQGNSARELMHNSREVCKLNSVKVFEEGLISTEGDVQYIFSIKSPWYSENGELMGSAGISFNLHPYSLLASLQKIRDLGLFQQITSMLGNDYYQVNDYSFTPRERECAYWLIRGYSAKQIALKLHLSFRTVEDYLQNMKDKMQVKSKQKLIEKLIDES